VYPFERFTDEAKAVLTLAQEEAERAHHSYIGTEHLLLALLRQESDARRILEELGVGLDAVRAALEAVLGRNPSIEIKQIIPTSRVKRVIELSFQLAIQERSASVTPVHILVGLLEEGEGIAAHVLLDLGVTPEKVEAVRRGQGESGPWPPQGARVLVHDPDPPYRLWEGSVSGHDEGQVRVVVPLHPTRPEALVAARELHGIPLDVTSACERCRHPGPGASG
jgi:hypothetical protein